jgi:amino acid adenylation domain-containing protein
VGAPVGLLLDRSSDAIVALIGILKAGSAYVPLSVDAPVARLQAQMRESGASVIVTTDAHLALVPSGATVVSLERDAGAIAAQAATPLSSGITPDSLCYVLYTSGSTGVPKGVAVTHANVVHYARGVAAVLAGEQVDPTASLDAISDWHFGMVSTLAADLGNTSLFGALLSGGALHLLSQEAATEPERFAAYLAEHPLDVLKITPNHFHALTSNRSDEALGALMPRRWLVTGGEALRLDVARRFAGAGRGGLLNHYGPTEATVGALTFVATTATIAAAEVKGAQTVPLGRPLANTRAYVMDGNGVEMPVGIPGELWIAGPGIANGYLNRPELTAERFAMVNGERAYRTGDRTRRLSDGTIEFLGRGDDQVKVRGYRVELAEIEAVLRQHPGIEQAAVLAPKDARGETTLSAFVVDKQAGYAVSHSDRPTAQKLSEFLAAQLPGYMVPPVITLLENMPLTRNGKIDRAVLMEMLTAARGQAASKVAPRSATEGIIAKIWMDVLKRDDVGVTESFLDLGGHSLLAIRVLGRISKELGVRLPLRTLFETPTVEFISGLVDAEKRKGADAAALQAALAAVENLSDAEVTALLSDGPSRSE